MELLVYETKLLIHNKKIRTYTYERRKKNKNNKNVWRLHQ